SLGGIFCAQVIEHLTTNQLIELLKLAHKKLQDGGKILLETLNPQCLMIYAECFYLDPSHTKPVHPLAVQFIAECQGFSSNEILYMTPSDQRLIIPNIPEKPEFDEPVNTINNLIFGNREYALIATK
ncbi:MAG: SAM-dependent methyltransferase, partial [Oscillospiraceae bacterium]